MSDALEYTVKVHTEEDGSLWAEVIELPGCFASGHAVPELLEALEEAIALYISDDPEGARIDTIEAPDDAPRRPLQVDEMRVLVPAD